MNLTENLNGTAGVVTAVCQKPAWFFALGEQLNGNYPYFGILTFIVGISGQCLNLWAFRRQAKDDEAYTYQSLLSICQIIEVISFLCLIFSLGLAGYRTPTVGKPWFMHSYGLMFYTAHMTVPLCHGIVLSTLLLSISVVADRVFAITNPAVYRNINHRRHRIVAFLICVSIGFPATAYNIFLYKLLESADYGYLVQSNTAYVTSPIGTYLAYGSNVIRLLSLLSLVGFNIALVRLYKKRMQKVSQMIITSQDGLRESKMRAAERSLVILAVTQSIFKGIRTLVSMSFYMATYTIPLFGSCDAVVFGPLNNIVIMICDTSDVCATVLVNAKTRRAIKGGFKRFVECVRKNDETTLTS